jgi:hypothetical protein
LLAGRQLLNGVRDPLRGGTGLCTAMHADRLQLERDSERGKPWKTVPSRYFAVTTAASSPNAASIAARHLVSYDVDSGKKR